MRTLLSAFSTVPVVGTLSRRVQRWAWWRAQRTALIVVGSPASKWEPTTVTLRQRLADTDQDPRWETLTGRDVRRLLRQMQPRVLSASPAFWAQALRLASRDLSLWSELCDWYRRPSHLPAPPRTSSPADPDGQLRFGQLLATVCAVAVSGNPSPSFTRYELDLLSSAPPQAWPALDRRRIKPLLNHPDRAMRSLGIQLLAVAAQAGSRLRATSSSAPASV